MDEALIELYRQSDYRVRLPAGGHASIRIGAPLPEPLAKLLRNDQENWVLITAWNPSSQRQPYMINRLAQRDLLKALRVAGARLIAVGIGVGNDGWRESALFATGLTTAAQDILMRRFGQNAIIDGVGSGDARLTLSTSCDVRPHGQHHYRLGQSDG